ncbi:DUF2911 domain-containing protein [Christiangramia aquimixticola]|uniref:DUF2911 domain-containing protein n=1 Tax=Christiangramia aquimixticola TaxID=1697558 RepID=UPI003AA864CD
MNRNLKIGLLITGILLFLVAILLFLTRYTTKAHSPEELTSYEGKDLKMEIFYNRPYKKGRKIFGALVPYNEVWRTGANEATTFTTNRDILVDGSLLPAGKYTLWTIPMEDSWKVIFNSQMYPWGINLEKKAYRDPTFDVLVLERPVNLLKEELEQFTIYFEESGEFVELRFAWDHTLIKVPILKEKAPESAFNISGE